MGQLTINVGTAVNKQDGDPTRTAWIKANNNFDELYERVSTIETGDPGATVTHNIIGNVYAENSSLLVDSANGSIPGYVSIEDLQGILAAATDFADFQTRIAAL